MGDMSTRGPAGDMLVRLRKQQGISQETLAELSGVPLGTIKTIETGRTRRPSKDPVYAIGLALQLDGEDLADWFAAAGWPDITDVGEPAHERLRRALLAVDTTDRRLDALEVAVSQLAESVGRLVARVEALDQGAPTHPPPRKRGR